jgi:hypothetical protein
MLMIEVFIGPKNAHPVKQIAAIIPIVRTPVGPFLPPVLTLIQDTIGLTARKINKTSRRDNKIGDRSWNVLIKANSAAPRIM